MADPVITPGTQTSEGKLAIVGTILGVLGAVVPPIWDALSTISAQYPQVHWLVALVSAVGMLTTVLVALGYAKARSAVKVAALSARE